jgi:hypothetical protein
VETTPVANKATSFTVVQAAGANLTTTTEIYHEDIGVTGNPAVSAGGSSRGTSEWVLKQNTQYAVVVANDDANDNTHNLVLNWYEE